MASADIPSGHSSSGPGTTRQTEEDTTSHSLANGIVTLSIARHISRETLSVFWHSRLRLPEGLLYSNSDVQYWAVDDGQSEILLPIL